MPVTPLAPVEYRDAWKEAGVLKNIYIIFITKDRALDGSTQINIT